MTIPFSLPVIDDDVIAEMMDTLTNTGWLTSGPKVRALEEEIRKFTESEAVLCVNSWTSGAMLVLHWFGVGPGDEVIVPAYTYCATAMCAMNLGAKPVMVDVRDDFTIDPEKIAEAITERTKAIIPVDLAGLPADYDAIREVLNREKIKNKFSPTTVAQKQLGRILLLADAAHSLGAKYKNVPIGKVADITVFSLHSVKNVTTGEGGAIVLNMPKPFDNAELLDFLRILSLNGQNKSALEKNAPGAWRYDIIAHGLKINMPDLCASVGLSQMRRYKTVFLPERKKIFMHYLKRFSEYPWPILPKHGDGETESSYHLFLLRIQGITEKQRDLIIQQCGEKGVGVNVHYIPMAQLTLFKDLGYNIDDYPNTLKLFKNEISLPIYNNLSEEQVDLVINTVINAYETVVQ
jgi:dTDP-4-amino-4,6-dideoxygalactose transaminase